MHRSLLLALVLLVPPVASLAQAAAPPAPTPSLQSAGGRALKEAAALAQAGKVAEATARLERDRLLLDLRGQSLLGALYLQGNRAADALAVLKPLADRSDAEAAVLYNAGRAALLKGDGQAGRVYLARSVDKQPDSPATRDLGLLLAREGQVVEGYRLLRPWTLVHADDGEARMVAASLAITLERPREARELLEGLADSPAVRLLAARVRVLEGDGPGALALVQPALAQHPPSIDLEVRRVAAEAYLLAGQPGKAVELLAGKAGKVPSLVLLLGRAQRQAGNAAAAMATLAPLATRIPADPRSLGDPRPAAAIAVEYGELLLSAGKTAEAVPMLQRATQIYPLSEPAWQSLGRALEAAGRGQEGAQARSKGQELARARAQAQAATPAAGSSAPPPPAAPAGAAAPAEMPAYATAALTLAQQGKPQQGLDLVRQRLQAAPEDELAHTLEVRMLLGMQQNSAALNAADAALARFPGHPDFVYMRGAVEMAMHDVPAAERDFREALRLSPRHLAAMSDLAVLLIGSGKKDEARKLLEEVLRINPRDSNAAANLEQLRKGTT